LYFLKELENLRKQANEIHKTKNS